MDFHLNGKRALITGGSKGIGLASAKALSDEGCDVVLVARIECDLNTAADMLVQTEKGKIQVCSCDVSDPDAGQMLCDKSRHIDILLKNAGAIPGGRLDQVTADARRAS